MNRKLCLAAILVFIASFTSAFAKTQSNITGTYESQSFEITNMSAIYHPEGYPSTYEIVGMAKNIGNSTYTNIQLSVELYDNNNTLIGVEQGNPTTDLRPGDTSPFKISTSESIKDTDFDHFHITVAGIKSDESGIESTTNGTNNSSSSGFVMPSKEGYDKCVNFGGQSFCDAILYEACMERARDSVTSVFNQTTCDNLLVTLKSKDTQMK
jgi:hypothetical protein